METKETKMKQCKHCGRILPVEMFGKVRRKNGEDFVELSLCKDCMKAKQDEGRKRAKAKQVMQNKEIAEKKAERLSVLSDFTPRELMEELARRGYEGELKYTQIIDITNF